MIDRIDHDLPTVFVDDGIDLPSEDQDQAERVDGLAAIITNVAAVTRRAYRAQQLQHRATKEAPYSKASSFFLRIPKFS